MWRNCVQQKSCTMWNIFCQPPKPMLRIGHRVVRLGVPMRDGESAMAETKAPPEGGAMAWDDVGTLAKRIQVEMERRFGPCIGSQAVSDAIADSIRQVVYE
jgi:hypothetical protein